MIRVNLSSVGSCSVSACYAQVNTLDEHEWHRLEQAHVLANVQQAFSDTGAADIGSEDEDMFAAGDMLSPTAGPSSASQSDAHALALMLQQQLDAINNEIRLAPISSQISYTDREVMTSWRDRNVQCCRLKLL